MDATQIEHVLLNVLENALAFSSPADPVELGASRDGDRLVVAIDDHGPGIRPADRERVFEPFDRGDGPTARDGPRARDRAGVRRGERRIRQGREIADRRRVFAVGFPLSALPAPTRERSRVLVVDDEPQILRALETTLPGAGDQVRTASTAEALSPPPPSRPRRSSSTPSSPTAAAWR